MVHEIVINGREILTDRYDLGYVDVVRMARMDPEADPSVTWSVGANTGKLLANQVISVVHSMTFTVVMPTDGRVNPI